MVGVVLTEWQAVTKKLPAFKAHTAALQDIEAQLKRLIGKQFITETPFERLQHFPRYLKGIQVRLDKLKSNPARDTQLMAEYLPLWTNYERRALQLAKMGTYSPQIEQFRWLLEELRISLFAQELKTPVPISSKRLQKQWEGIQHGQNLGLRLDPGAVLATAHGRARPLGTWRARRTNADLPANDTAG